MKNILVPVDFSPASDNALLFASFLAKRLAWNIHILNGFHLPNPMVTLPIELVITLDELKSDSDSALKKLAADASAKSGLSIEQYHIESRNGGTVHEIVDYARYIHASLVVMGMKPKNNYREFITGSASTDLIRKSGPPVLLVPSESNYQNIEKITFATDGSPLPSADQMELFRMLTDTYSCEVEICHISSSENTEHRNEVITKLEGGFMGIPHSYVFPIASDINEGLEKVIKSNGSQLVAITAHPHNWITRMSGNDHSRSMAFETTTPLFVMHA
ncbi:MAG: universal stress protein [Bacteroidota bacterium]